MNKGTIIFRKLLGKKKFCEYFQIKYRFQKVSSSKKLSQPKNSKLLSSSHNFKIQDGLFSIPDTVSGFSFIKSEIYHRSLLGRTLPVRPVCPLRLKSSDSSRDASSLGCERQSRPLVETQNGGRWLFFLSHFGISFAGI